MPRLTEITIRNARPATSDVSLADGGCLFLRIRRSADDKLSHTWIVRIKRRGTRRVYRLGSYPFVTIKQARAKAAGIVATERGEARASVAVAIEEFMDSQIRPKYRRLANAEVYNRAIAKELGALSVDAVRALDVSRMVRGYKRTAPVAAMRLLSFAKHFFCWCVSIGYADRSPAADVKPGAFGVDEKSRERILTDDEIRAFWHATDLQHVPLLRILLLTGLRIQEAQRAQQQDVDADYWLTIPAEHTKNGKEHRAYLPPLARAQIEKESKPLLFHGVSPTAVQAALKRWQVKHEIKERWTPHDLRRTFASRCGDLGIAPHVIAKVLNHTIPGGDSLPVNLRSEWLEERKEAATALAAHVVKVVSK